MPAPPILPTAPRRQIRHQLESPPQRQAPPSHASGPPVLPPASAYPHSQQAAATAPPPGPTTPAPPSHVSPATHPILSSLSPAELALGAYAIAAAKTYGLTPEALIGVNHLANATAPEKATLRDIAGSAREVPPAATIRQQTLPVRASGKQLATPDTARQFTGAPPRQGTLAALAAKGQAPTSEPASRANLAARAFANNPAFAAKGTAAGAVYSKLSGSLTNKKASRKLQTVARSGSPQQLLNVAGAIAPKRTKKALGGLLFATTGNTPPGKKGSPQQQLLSGLRQQGGQKQAAHRQQRRRVARNIIQEVAATGSAKVGAHAPLAVELAKADVVAGRKYGIPPSVLFNQQIIESGLGTNTGPSTAGAQGISQFLPSTRDSVLQQSGHDAFKGPMQAALAQAFLLKQAGFHNDPAGAVFSYNHSTSYVNDVLNGAKDFARLDKLAAGQVAGVGASQSVSLKDPNSPYVYPFKPGIALGRTDMGVDMSYDGPVRALGNAVVEKNKYNRFTGYGNPDQGIVYTLTDGPFQGRSVFVYENGFFPRNDLKAGDKLKKGEVVGHSTTSSPTPTQGTGSSLEMGFAYKDGTPLAAATYSEGEVTHWGTVMHDLITGKRVTTATGGAGAGFAGTGTSGVATGTTGGTGAAPSGVRGVAGTIAAPGRRAAAQARARVGFTLPFSPTEATSALPFGYGGSYTGAAPSGSRGSFRPTRRLSTSR